MASTPPWLCAALLSLGLACGTSGGEADSGSSTGLTCEDIDRTAPETECGTIEDTDECSGGSDAGGDTGDPGGTSTGSAETGDSGDECGTIEAANAAVVACVQQAQANGEAFAFGWHFYQFGGQYDSHYSYHVNADGMMWRSASGESDLCTWSETTVHGVVDLSDCESWECLENRAEAAPVVETCEASENCDGV